MRFLMHRHDSFTAFDCRFLHRSRTSDAMKLMVEAFCSVRSAIDWLREFGHTASVTDCVATFIAPPQRSYIRSAILARHLPSIWCLRCIVVALALGNRKENYLFWRCQITICGSILVYVQRARDVCLTLLGYSIVESWAAVAAVGATRSIAASTTWTGTIRVMRVRVVWMFSRHDGVMRDG